MKMIKGQQTWMRAVLFASVGLVLVAGRASAQEPCIKLEGNFPCGEYVTVTYSDQKKDQAVISCRGWYQVEVEKCADALWEVSKISGTYAPKGADVGRCIDMTVRGLGRMMEAKAEPSTAYPVIRFSVKAENPTSGSLE